MGEFTYIPQASKDLPTKTGHLRQHSVVRRRVRQRIRARHRRCRREWPNISRCQHVLTSIKVVISFVLASTMTTAASILAMILDNAYDSKGQFTLHAPIKYIRERFLDTEWKKDYAWRPFLDPLIIGFGDQQLVTGYAVLLSAWIKVKLPDTLRCFELTSH